MMFHNANTMKILEEFHWENSTQSYPDIHFFIFNYQLDQRATRMLHWFQNNRIQCTLINSIDKEPIEGAVNIPNSLYNGLWNKMVELTNTEVSFILTSDVTIPDINQLLINTKVFEDKDVIAYSPTIFYSHWNYKKTRKYNEKMDEVPILDGMCYGMRKEIIDHIGKIPLHINKSGWIQEPLIGMYAQKNNKKLIRDNSIIVLHPPHRGYNQEKAAQEERTYLKYKGIEKEYFEFKIAVDNISIVKKNIVFIWHEESLTGSVKVIYEIVKYLIYRHSKNYNFYIFSLRKKENKFHEELNTNYIKDIPGKSLNEKVKNVIKILKPHKVYGNTIDVAHIIKLFKDKKVKTILHCHELEDGFNNFQIHTLKSPLNEFIPITAHDFIAVSDGTEKILKENGAKNIHRIPSFINQNNTKIKAYTLLEPKTKKRIVGCGTGTIRKGLDRFISLAHKLPTYEFIWVGSYLLENNKIKVRNYWMDDICLDKPDNLILYGVTDNPYPIIKSADIFLLTSRLDPDPLVVKEALTLRVPVITIKESGESWKYTDNYLENYDEDKMIEMLQKDYAVDQDYNFDIDNFIQEIEKLVIDPPRKLYV